MAKSGAGAQARLIAGRVRRRGRLAALKIGEKYVLPLMEFSSRPVARGGGLALKATPLTFWFSDESQSP